MAVELDSQSTTITDLQSQLSEAKARLDAEKRNQISLLEKERTRLELEFADTLERELAECKAKADAEAKAQEQELARLKSRRESETSPFKSSPILPISVDRLQTTIKQSEARVSLLQAQLQSAIKTRDEMAEELVRATNENDELQQKLVASEAEVTEKVQLKIKYALADPRFDKCLEILGEKTERVLELEADIQDMKEAYKTHIQSSF